LKPNPNKGYVTPDDYQCVGIRKSGRRCNNIASDTGFHPVRTDNSKLPNFEIIDPDYKWDGIYQCMDCGHLTLIIDYNVYSVRPAYS
jgi:hypothetical protein